MLPELDVNRVQIQRVVSSKAFKTSEVHRNLLNYLAEKSLSGEAQSLKEYTVGLDVFGKPASYDPRQESVVRMHVGRLRQKLTEYYRSEGQDDPVIVDLPKGGFTLTFAPRPVAGIVSPEPPAAPPPRDVSMREIVLALSLLLAIVLAGYFGVRLSRVEKSAETAASFPWTPELQQLWGPLLSSDRPLMVTLATDPFHTNGQGATVAPGGAGAASGGSGVTGVGTANAAFLLGEFLGQRKRNVFPIRSDLLSMGEIAMGDVIFVGSTVGKPQIQAIPPVDQPFVLTPEGVKNLMPQGREPAFLEDVPQKGGQELEESHALISNLPGLYGNGKILYLSGNTIASVMGAVQALTDPDLAKQLVASLKTSNGSLPRFYQVVLRVKAMDDTPLEISFLFHRELQLSKSAAATAGSR
jgi:hypothetical protein